MDKYSNYMEVIYGKEYAPYCVTKAGFIVSTPEAQYTKGQPTPSLSCAVCKENVLVTKFLPHFNSQHADHLPRNISCPACKWCEERAR